MITRERVAEIMSVYAEMGSNVAAQYVPELAIACYGFLELHEQREAAKLRRLVEDDVHDESCQELG